MNKEPLISVITVCFNSSKTIKTCLESVESQSYLKIEHIVIDGDSTDGTQEIIKGTKPSFFLSEPDKGIYNAMNKGLANATGEYCLFLNADDSFTNSNVLQNMVSCLKTEDLICAGIEIFKGHKLYRKYKATSFKPWMFIFGHQPPHPGFLCKTELIRKVGGFNESFKIAGDFDLMLKVFNLPELKWRTANIVAVNMQHGGASSGSFDKKNQMNKEVKRSLKANNKPAFEIFIWAKYLFKVFQVRV